MRRLFAGLALAGGMVLSATVLRAEDLAVIVANTGYQNHSPYGQSETVIELAQVLRQAGFQTVIIRNLTSSGIDRQMSDLATRIDAADHAVVVLSGYFASVNAGGSYMLTVDAFRPDPLTVGRVGVPVQGMLDLLGRNPGNVILALATPGNTPPISPQLAPGVRIGDIPQGVALVIGTPLQVRVFLPELLVPGRPMVTAGQFAPEGLRYLGYKPRDAAFIEGAATLPLIGTPSETTAWREAGQANTVAAYQRYLRDYPNGMFAAQATARIADLELTPQDRAHLEEEALKLGRDQRARLQQYLTILGYDTRGIDGVFGPNTRNAIRQFQASVEVPQTGYMTANQVTRIETIGAARAEVLRREAEQRRGEEEARDRDYWQGTGASGTEQGLFAYLERYPQGLHADESREALNRIEREKRRESEVGERLAWDRAVIAGTLASYQAYLGDYPDGRFEAEARARINVLSEPQIPPEVLAQAKATEEALRLDPFRKQLIEIQLDRLNQKPGPTDGTFTDETRAAIRRYQRANGLNVTGFVDRQLILGLLVNALQ